MIGKCIVLGKSGPKPSSSCGENVGRRFRSAAAAGIEHPDKTSAGTSSHLEIGDVGRSATGFVGWVLGGQPARRNGIPFNHFPRSSLAKSLELWYPGSKLSIHQL